MRRATRAPPASPPDARPSAPASLPPCHPRPRHRPRHQIRTQSVAFAFMTVAATAVAVMLLVTAPHAVAASEDTSVSAHAHRHEQAIRVNRMVEAVRSASADQVLRVPQRFLQPPQFDSAVFASWEDEEESENEEEEQKLVDEEQQQRQQQGESVPFPLPDGIDTSIAASESVQPQEHQTTPAAAVDATSSWSPTQAHQRGTDDRGTDAVVDAQQLPPDVVPAGVTPSAIRGRRSVRHAAHHRRRRKGCPAVHGKTQYLCPSKNANRYDVCITREQLCNHVPDCPNGEDENPQACMFYQPIDEQLKTLSHAVLLLVDNVMGREEPRAEL